MQLCFFDDALYSRFHPLTLTRPVDDLRIGILTLCEKWLRTFEGATFSRTTRPELQPLFSAAVPDDSQTVYWINSRYLPKGALVDKVKRLDAGTCLRANNTVIAARVDGTISRQWVEVGTPDFNNLLVVESTDFPSINYLWDLFLMNADEIKADLERLKYPSSKSYAISPAAVLQNKENIFIGEGASIEAGVIIIADEAPVYIGEEATVMAGAIVRGPVAVCKNATVKMGAKIYPGTTIGPSCKVGGEVSNSIFHSYSNKGHDGFAGNSLIGQWCNLGAGTNTSNLKNNYSAVRITDWKSGDETNTGQQFLGTVMGDHSKTAINTKLNTGTVCGVSCNIFSADFPPKHIPSFSWVGSNVIQTYNIDKAFETMKAVMARRDMELTEAYKKLMQRIFIHEHG